MPVSPGPEINPRPGEPDEFGVTIAIDPAPAERIETHLLEYLRILHKRRWTALTVFALVVGAVTAYVFTTTPLYEARAQLLIEAENPNVVAFKQVIEQDKTTTDYYQTQYKILQSRSLAHKTLDALNLWNDDEFARDEQSAWVRTVSEWGHRLGGERFDRSAAGVLDSFKGPRAPEQPEARTAASGVDEPGETAEQSRTIDAFLRRLIISPVRNSRLVDVLFVSTSPQRAAQIVNAVVRVYIDSTVSVKFLASKEASDWLGQQLNEQRGKVEQSELALQRYRERGDAVALEDRENIVAQRLADLNTALTKARADRIQKETLYNRVKALQSSKEGLDTVPAIMSNAFIQQLKGELAQRQSQQAQLAENFGDKHPDMLKMKSTLQATEQKLQAEIAKVVDSIENDYLAAVSQERALNASLDSQKGEVLQLSRKGIEYGALRRERETNRQVFDSLLQRAKETGIGGELKTSNIRVVDAAEVPRRPAKPNKTIAILSAVIGGAILGIGLAFSVEYLDDRIKSPAEVKNVLHLPLLGMVPALSRKDAKNGPPMIGSTAPPNFTEAFMGVRTGILFSTAEEGSKSLVVTSTAPQEGKTLMASSLAITLAQAGLRVLLIDADLRRPRLHDLFDKELEPGLSNLMVTNVEASRVIRESSIPGLWLITAGPQPPRPADLFGSARFRTFLASLKEYFDWVIIDTPPVMAVADAAVISHSASGVVFVVGCEMTSRHTARAALDTLAATAKGKMFGVILNRVNVDKNAYYYSAYYRRDYQSYQRPGDRLLPAERATVPLRSKLGTTTS
jgi:capsular exopolysaccharide synthesis family protein